MKRIVINTIAYFLSFLGIVGGIVVILHLCTLFPRFFVVVLGLLAAVFASFYFAKLEEESLPPENEESKDK